MKAYQYQHGLSSSLSKYYIPYPQETQYLDYIHGNLLPNCWIKVNTLNDRGLDLSCERPHPLETFC